MSTLYQGNIKLLHSQVGRFLIVGITTVLVDFVVYLLLLFFDFETGLAILLTLPIGVTHSKVKERGF